MENKENKESTILLYKTENGNVNLNVIFKDDTIWLSQKSIAELFECSSDNISLHLKNIFIEKELEKKSTTEIFSIVQKEGQRNVKRNIELYNLDAIIAVGYRVNTKKATEFRIWATNTLKVFITKGYVLDKERLKNGIKFGKDYFDELLVEIKEIRLSERRVYQKITDIFEITSSDYNKDSEEAYTFFKIVQNKLHYAITGKTAAELIFERVDSAHESLGLTNWKNSPDGKIYKYDINIAKNYLSKDEIKKLESLTILFLDYAEDMTLENTVMTMRMWIEATDKLLSFRNKQILMNSGEISHIRAMEKANIEYEKYRINQDLKYLSSMDKLYIDYLKNEEQ